MKQLLIFTDLDGSLLNHDDYQWHDAKPMLTYCQNQQIPVIANTSKTHAELCLLKSTIPLADFHIVENGGGIFTTQPCLSSHFKPFEGAYFYHALVKPAAYWQKIVNDVLRQLNTPAFAFSKLSPNALQEITHLSYDEIKLAQARLFSEPIYLPVNYDKTPLLKALTEAGGEVLIGGRFMHVSGKTNKGIALLWLQEFLSQQQQKDFISIAIGDGHNDIAMLEAADIALIIPSPVHELPKLDRTEGVYIANQPGAKGWNAGLRNIFDEFNKN